MQVSFFVGLHVGIRRVGDAVLVLRHVPMRDTRGRWPIIHESLEGVGNKMLLGVPELGLKKKWCSRFLFVRATQVSVPR